MLLSRGFLHVLHWFSHLEIRFSDIDVHENGKQDVLVTCECEYFKQMCRNPFFLFCFIEVFSDHKPFTADSNEPSRVPDLLTASMRLKTS